MSRPVATGQTTVWLADNVAHDFRAASSHKTVCRLVIGTGSYLPAQDAFGRYGAKPCDGGCWPYAVTLEDYGDLIYAMSDDQPALVIAEAVRITNGGYYRWSVRADGHGVGLLRKKAEARTDLAALAQRVLTERDKAGAP